MIYKFVFVYLYTHPADIMVKIKQLIIDTYFNTHLAFKITL